jgi:integrase
MREQRNGGFHALRDTFGTHLAAAGVAPFVLKELMRHSTVQQSEKYYIDATHLPIAAAMELLPKFTVCTAGPVAGERHSA